MKKHWENYLTLNTNVLATIGMWQVWEWCGTNLVGYWLLGAGFWLMALCVAALAGLYLAMLAADVFGKPRHELGA